MADAQPRRPAGEPAVGEQQDVLAQAGALDGAGDGEHLAHARPALGALVADDDDVAGAQRALGDGVHGALLAVEDARGALEGLGVEAGRLHHGTLGGQGSVQDAQPAGAVERVVHRVDDRAVGVGRSQLGEVLRHRPARDGQRVAVQQAGVQQGLEDDGDAADAVHVGHHEPAERLHVGQEGGAVTDPVEVLEREVDLGLVGDRHQVQHRVRRAPEGHDDGDGVLEGLLGHDLPGGDALAEHVHHGLARGDGVGVTTAVRGGRRGAPGERHAQRLRDAGHRVGGVHPAAGALTRAGGLLDGVQLVAGDQPTGAGADGLEDVDDRQVPVVEPPGHGRPGVEEDAGQVEARGGHEHAGQRLVAAGEQHRAVQPLREHHRLHRVGDDLAGDQRRTHALVAHGDAVGDRDGAELQGEAACGADAVLRPLGEPVQGEVAGGDLVPGRRDADLRLGEVVVAHAHRAEHGAGGGSGVPVGHLEAARLHGVGLAARGAVLGRRHSRRC